jgi:nucleotide-binding universal stress UspA family protein
MKTIQRIVAAIDFSVYSPEILENAAGIAERHSAEIIAVNIINKRLFESIQKEFDDDHLCVFSLDKFILDETRTRTENLRDLLVKWVPNRVATRIVIRSGVPFEEILKVVDEEDADLIVVNSKGRTNFQDYMYGTTSEKIFAHSPVSILSLNLRTWC